MVPTRIAQARAEHRSDVTQNISNRSAKRSERLGNISENLAARSEKATENGHDKLAAHLSNKSEQLAARAEKWQQFSDNTAKLSEGYDQAADKLDELGESGVKAVPNKVPRPAFRAQVRAAWLKAQTA